MDKLNRKAHNSTLRPVSKKRQAEIKAGKRPKKPLARGKKPVQPKGAATLERLLGEGKVFKASTLAPRKPTGEKAVFREIWDERPHHCEVCKVAIREATASNFSHLLPKGTYPEFRLDKRNIVLKCEACHEVWHKEGPGNLMLLVGWTDVCDRYYELKREANGVKP
mgnify:CR=1 FL=1|jgi:hypothetical protein